MFGVRKLILENIHMRALRNFLIVLMFLTPCTINAQKIKKHTFKLGTTEFLLDGQPFQIISGELHPARIPVEYWRHRIAMAKALGCNTIAVYDFWNYHESEDGVFDFETGNHNIAEFIKIVQEEGMWVLMRPGPYVCAEWDLGGIPPYLLKYKDIKLRSLDPVYMAAAERYMKNLSEQIKPLLVTNGGPILMLQIENEYGSFGKDNNYPKKLKEIWISLGIDVPTFNADGASEEMLKAGTLPGSAVGLNSGTSAEDFALAARINPGVPVFSSETYPGWLTHWGEKWAKPDTLNLIKELRFLMDNRKSFNLYVVHGGTNFGYTAGANSGGKGYEPHVTSYDYDAPINEQGQATRKFILIRDLISSYLPAGKKLPPIPEPVPAIELTSIDMVPFTAVWDNLPAPVTSLNPGTFDTYGQEHGFILYKTELTGTKHGKLVVNDIHDYATVFLNGVYIGALDRRAGINSIEIPENDAANPILEIFVEAMGHINYGEDISDRKGITESVTLDGTVLQNWSIYNLPMDKKFIWDLRSTGRSLKKPGVFFRGNFFLSRAAGQTGADSYIDMSGYTKGLVWINGHNIGRYWNIGPQQKLFCPSGFMREGVNEIMVFDLHQTIAKKIPGVKTAE